MASTALDRIIGTVVDHHRVVLAMLGAFPTSVVVLPSLLYVWARRVRSVPDPVPATGTGPAAGADDD